MKKIDILTLVISISCFLTGTIVIANNPEEYQPVPPGTFFSITNNNTQNSEESRRTTRVEVTRPPKIVNNIPITHPHTPAPVYTPHQPQPTPVIHEFKDKPKYHHESSHEHFASYYAKIKEVPSLFTFKNCLIALGIVSCCYGVLYVRLFQLVNNAKWTNGWGSFQEHIPPSDLNSLEPLALADGIIEEIKLRYPLINPSNLMPSILLFNKDVEQELDELTSFINFYSWLTTYKLSALFPNQEKLMMRAQQKIQRLHILQDAITEWINKHVTRLMRNQPVPRQSGLTKRKNKTVHRHKNTAKLLAPIIP